MRVLAHVHTFNDVAVIGQSMDTLRRQTRRPDAILVVDNASTDGTLDQPLPEGVTVIRNSANLGTSGAICVGFAHALRHGFDWIWVLDADSVPEPEALENMLGFFERLEPSQREQVSFLGCRLASGGDAAEAHRPIVLTPTGVAFAPFDADAEFTRCDCFIWSGSMFRMAAVAKIGEPCADYFLDLAELEYGYRARRIGLTGYIVNDALLHHDVGRPPGFATRTWRYGPFSFRLLELSPVRCYYYVRNMLYFWLYEFRPRRARRILRSIVHAICYPRTFAVRPVSHGRHFIACLRGTWDGLTGHIERRY